MSPEQIRRIEEITGERFRMYHYPALRERAGTVEQIEEITGRRFRAYDLPAIREVLASDERADGAAR